MPSTGGNSIIVYQAIGMWMGIMIDIPHPSAKTSLDFCLIGCAELMLDILGADSESRKIYVYVAPFAREMRGK